LNINIENYEIWFLDYAEGNLDESQKQELFAFLADHPELKNELEEFEILEVNLFETKFPDKSSLKKTPAYNSDDFIAYHEGDLSETEKKEVESIIASNPSAKKEFDQLAKMYLQPDCQIVFQDKDKLKSENLKIDQEMLIAFHEGDLAENQQKSVLALIQSNPEAKKEFDQIGKLYLSADATVIFPDKSKLKKKEGLIIPLFVRYAAVAASLLLVISLFFLSEEQQYEERETYVENSEDNYAEDEGEDTLEIPFKNNVATQDLIEPIPFDQQIAVSNSDKSNKGITPFEKVPEENSIANNQNPNLNNAKVSEPSALDLKQITSLEVASNLPSKLGGYKSLPNVVLLDDIEDNVALNTGNENSQTNSANESISLLAFVEEKAAQAVTGEKKKKLRLFDVIKKVGDKSKLYDLNEKENNQFTLKVLTMEMEGKRKRISL